MCIRDRLRFVRPRFHAKALREIVSCGLPSFLNNIAGRVTSIIMNVVLLAIGGQNAVSVYGILMTMDGFVHPLLYGMCDSLQPAVGFNWGARNIKRVKSIELRCYTAAITLALATTAVLALFPRQIAGDGYKRQPWGRGSPPGGAGASPPLPPG